MNDEQFRELLTDYLAGELDEQRAAAFRAELEADEERRKLVDELQAAAAALEANVLSREEAEQHTQSLRLEGIAPDRAASASERVRHMSPLAHPRGRAALRYVAVIILAFGAGFVVRGWQSDEHKAPPLPTAAPSPINERYVARFVQATQSFPKSSAFSRSLLTLARK